MAKKIIFIVSLIFNVLFILLLVFIFSIGGNTASFTSINHGDGYFSNAFIVSVPVGSDVGFGAVEISLAAGSSAYLQFSAILGGKQSSMAMEPLYDHNVVSVTQSGLGIVIKAINPGEATLQLFSPSGFKDVAYVTVY